MVKAHRLAFEEATGESPPVVDHLCHDSSSCNDDELCPHRRCCNPRHLGPSTIGKNAERSLLGKQFEMCRSGLHEMHGDNVEERADGRRQCRACVNTRRRETMKIALRADAKRARRRPYGMTRAATVEWFLAQHDDSDPPEVCWPWPSKPDRQGYITVRVEGKVVGSHRLVCEVINGPIPKGWHADHVCHDPNECEGGPGCPHRRCARPSHLQAKPGKVNQSRERSSSGRKAMHCKRGHRLAGRNLYVVEKTGARVCLKCSALRLRKHRAKLKRLSGWVDGRYRKGGLCPKGHDVTVTGLTKDRKCAECHRVRTREAKRVVRLEAGAVPQRVDDKKCRHGHDISTEFYLNKRGVKECRACKRAGQARAKQKAKERAAAAGWVAVA